MKKATTFLFLSALVLLLCYGADSIRYSSQALTIWFESLVPSMFVCMVLIRVLYKQQVIAQLCPNILCKAFHLSKEGLALVISCMLLGFPNGSVLIDESLAKGAIQKTTAKRLFLICSFPTPCFVILTVGVLIFHQVQYGVWLYLSQLMSGILFLLFYREKADIERVESFPCNSSFMNDLGTAMKESGFALFMMGGYLMLFMTVTGLLFSFLPMTMALPLRIVSEFSSGIFLIQSTTLPLSACLLASCALLGFGGFCVHMQIYAMIHTIKVSYLRFFLFRMLQAAVSVLFFCLLTFLFV